MAVKVSKLWGSARFQNLSQNAKLLYLYLLTNPQLNQLGVFQANIQTVLIETSFSDNELREASKQLISNKYISVKKYTSIYFIVYGIFNKNIQSENTILKLQNILSLYPPELVSYLETLNIKLPKKVSVFKIPTPEEVSEYAKSLGYNIDGKGFVDFYNNSSETRLDGKWQDGRGKVITDWKAKLRRVWCKGERKIKVVEGCPKGMENLSIKFMDKDYYPESWVDGLPKHSDFGVTKMLQKEFNRLK